MNETVEDRVDVCHTCPMEAWLLRRFADQSLGGPRSIDEPRMQSYLSSGTSSNCPGMKTATLDQRTEGLTPTQALQMWQN